MTLEETRKLGIEFERRVQTMIPDTEFADKLDTETIYSYLNQYQDKYIHEIFRNLDSITPGTKIQAHVDSVLQSLLHTEQVLISDENVDQHMGEVSDNYGNIIVDTARSINYPLDKTFYMYVRSVSNVSGTYSFRAGTPANDQNTGTLPIRILPNQLISQNDLWRLLETPHDSLRILRYPAAVLTEEKDFYREATTADTSATKYYKATDGSGWKVDDGGTHTLFVKDGKVPTLTVIYDQYTTPRGIKVTYYKEPNHFSLMTSTPCELPMDAFEELVSGAVDLYVQYVAGAEARKRQLEEARRQAAKEQEANNARRNRREE